MDLLLRLAPLIKIYSVRRRPHLLAIHLSLFCFLLSISLQAQEQLQINHYSLDQGYYDGIVTTIYQDMYQFIWIGTADGLYRYDGYSFKEYRKNVSDPNALKSSVITDIEEDDNGQLWIGTEGAGLNLFFRTTNHFMHFRHDPNDPQSIISDFISEILLDHKGNLWIGTDNKGLSVLKYDKKSNDFYFKNFESFPEKLPSSPLNKINHLFEDSRGNIWVGTKGGLASMRYDSLDELSITYYEHDPDLPDSSLADSANSRGVCAAG